MSEYWKSTPKYWCKHCKTFVKDTKIEKANHEATPKHQGNLQRFLRELHKGHEREERDKQKAKNEVDRLNGLVSGSRSGTHGGERTITTPLSNVTARQATPAERKKQLQQLAEMGVAVPEDFRREMAMAGDWQTTSQRAIYDGTLQVGGIKKEEGLEDSKIGVLNVGVRKRKFEGQDEEEEGGEQVVRRGWGSTTKTYPGSAENDDDLNALLRKTSNSALPGQGLNPTSSTILPGDISLKPEHPKLEASDTTKGATMIKQEQLAGTLDSRNVIAATNNEHAVQIKNEEGAPGSGIMFKKRKPKATQSK